MNKMLEYAATEQLLILIVTLLVPPVLILVILILLLATFGKSLGLRRAYVNLLLRIFEWASKRIERARLEQENDSDNEDNENDSETAAHKSERERTPSGKSLIKKDASIRIMRTISQEDHKSDRVFTIVDDSLDFVKAGIESIIEDDVTLRFSAEELASWNLLSRTSYGHQYFSVRLTILWCLGFIFRYLILFPFRMIIFIIGLTFLVVSTAVVGYVPDGEMKRLLNWHVSLMCYRVLSRAVSVIATFHNKENRADPGGICVANHTSPIDVLILAQDNCYALVGQSHGGVLGLIQRSLSRASAHIWFDRSEANDRNAVRKRLQDHVHDIDKLPILLFPEGTCINNTSVMMFKKGSFEVGGYIYPVAIKYDARFGDAFWNSSTQSYMQYLIMMMTSWAIVVDVWYLPPMTKAENETAVEFAARVKRAIAAAGGLVDLEWDGQLKRYPVKKEMIEKQQEIYSKRIQLSQDDLNDIFRQNSVKSLVELVQPKLNNLQDNHQTSNKENNVKFVITDKNLDNFEKYGDTQTDRIVDDGRIRVLGNGNVVTGKFVELENIKEKIDNEIISAR